ncbi:class I SAM-dependent methyltransferase [Pseudomonas citronellolis]|uniref:class I SAM-dependent methyltransferase n=1 Tax=Pseudomonas citronellolis TaxID=53408 RepID=UPI0023E3D8FE|nr:class I SAM-dependent methyltransferase [Pseudomonas citronellolis]MDF3936912.1 class I SAM-dependent methyltransferase [Pseudomonas citronellolis]
MLIDLFTRMHEQALQRQDYALASAMVRSRLCLEDAPHLLFEAAKLYALLGYKELAAVFADRFTDRLFAEPEDSELRHTLEQIVVRDLPWFQRQAQEGPEVEPNAGDYNTRFRLQSLAASIRANFPEATPSVLDVGGGRGDLALYLDDCPYLLAEPGVNGLSGLELPFADGSFDCVVSSHVYEHIPADQRPLFLDELARVAKSSVIMLNPFWIEQNEVVESSLRLIYDYSSAGWAKEHLECGMPKVAEVTEWAERHGYACRVTPNGNKPLGIAMVFVQLMARGEKDARLLKDLTSLLTQFAPEAIDSPAAPNAYLIEIDKRGQ